MTLIVGILLMLLLAGIAKKICRRKNFSTWWVVLVFVLSWIGIIPGVVAVLVLLVAPAKLEEEAFKERCRQCAERLSKTDKFCKLCGEPTATPSRLATPPMQSASVDEQLRLAAAPTRPIARTNGRRRVVAAFAFALAVPSLLVLLTADVPPTLNVAKFIDGILLVLLLAGILLMLLLPAGIAKKICRRKNFSTWWVVLVFVLSWIGIIPGVVAVLVLLVAPAKLEEEAFKERCRQCAERLSITDEFCKLCGEPTATPSRPATPPMQSASVDEQLRLAAAPTRPIARTNGRRRVVAAFAFALAVPSLLVLLTADVPPTLNVAKFDDAEAQLRVRRAIDYVNATTREVDELRQALDFERKHVVLTDADRDLNQETIRALEVKLRDAETKLLDRKNTLKAAQEIRRQGLNR